MRRSRAPGTVSLVGVVLCLLTVPAATTTAESGEVGAGPAAAPTTTTLAAVAEPRPTVGVKARRDHGFVCERRTVEVSAGSPTLKVGGTLAVKSLTCQDCCQENILFEDDFEQGSTGAWSSTLP